jgi:hypothetical protein
LGGIVTEEAGAEGDEEVGAVDGWERLCFEFKEEGDGGFQIGKDER